MNQVEAFLRLRFELLNQFEEACPHVNGTSEKKAMEDRRDMYWRLADDDQSLIYGEEAQDVMVRADGTFDMGESTFVDNVLRKAIWRPEGENVVMVLVNTCIGDPDVIVFLSPMNECVATNELITLRQEEAFQMDMQKARDEAVKKLKTGNKDIDDLHNAIAHVNTNHPLPRCSHGNAMRDHAGDILEPSCGCRLGLAPLTDE